MTICNIPECNKESDGEMFCEEHDRAGFHNCEICSAYINMSIYVQKYGGCICQICFEKEPRNIQDKALEEAKLIRTALWDNAIRMPYKEMKC